MKAGGPEAAPISASDESIESTMGLIQEAIGRIRAIRGELGVPPGSKVDVDIVSANTVRLDLLDLHQHHVRNMTNIGALRFGSAHTLAGFASTAVIEDVTIHVMLPEDLRAQERRGLQGNRSARKGVAGAEKKLGNDKFVGAARPKSSRPSATSWKNCAPIGSLDGETPRARSVMLQPEARPHRDLDDQGRDENRAGRHCPLRRARSMAYHPKN